MTKLSKAQKRVLHRMANGWNNYGGYGGLQMPGKPNLDEFVTMPTNRALKRAGLIAEGRYQFELTPEGAELAKNIKESDFT